MTTDQPQELRTPPSSEADRCIKRRRVLDILDTAGADSLLLSSQTALSWYLDGSRVHISLAADPVAALLVDRNGDHLVTYNNEAERLASEEIPSGVSVLQVPWYGNLHDVESWFGAPSGPAPLTEQAVARQLRDARRSLLPAETERYARLCRDAAAALTDVLAAATPRTTERQIAARLAERVVSAGADPLVLLCNGDSRVSYRHPLPTEAPLGRRAMAVVCARRDGMIANVTRWVRFGEAGSAESDAEARIAAVESDLLRATVPGARLNEILAELGAAYLRHGFGADQWRLHHQGGTAGYAGRDPRATESTDDRVVVNQAFTWNPSGPGVKIEDTMLLTASGMKPLTADDRWPTALVDGLARPVTLEL
ncbi:M24 family metallopeptidase [Arthrobacter sp.]|uniref:M24 family metallopeptidase n=1 Tax=Arthrobacter sp. TaxID=1667 RepID=UPI0033970900